MIENDRLDEARAMIGKLACGCGVEGFGATASLLADAMKEAGADPAKAMKASLEADAETFPSLAPLAKAVGKGDSSGAVELAWKIENDVNEVPSLRNDFGESISKGSVIGIAKGHMESDADGGFEKDGVKALAESIVLCTAAKAKKGERPDTIMEWADSVIESADGKKDITERENERCEAPEERK